MRRSYVIYATMPWDGPWNVEHNVAHALAEHNRVLYVDPPISPVSPFRYGLRQASIPRVAALFNRRVRNHDRLQVFGALALPPLTHPRAAAVSLPLVRAQIRRAVDGAGLESPVVVAWRSLEELSGAAGESLRVGIVMDNLPAAAGLLARDPDDLEREMHATCRASDLLCVTSQAVQGMLRQQGWSSELLPFGFSADLAPLYDAAPPPDEYKSLPRPLLGYTGSVDDRLDYQLILELADRFANGSVVFVGAVSPRLSAQARDALASRANIHVLGVRPRASLPGYVRYLDCGLLPYADTEFVRYQSPMKVWDYMYAGIPILGTGALDLRRYSAPLVHYAEDSAHALELAVELINSDDGAAELRRRFALQNTWEMRAQQLGQLVERALEERRGHRAGAGG
jgi:teichuronic acid biosynthesis glycosyltransferase TuaH